MPRTWYVYELVDPRNDEVFYVGKGAGNRMLAHGKRGDKTNSHKLRIINKVGYDNVIRRKLKEFTDEQEAYIFESDRMVELYPKGFLCNACLSTTLVQVSMKPQPKITLSECIGMLRNAGWMYVIDLKKYKMVLPNLNEDGSDMELPDSLAKKTMEILNECMASLRQHKKNGRKVPDKVKSRNVDLILDYSEI